MRKRPIKVKVNEKEWEFPIIPYNQEGFKKERELRNEANKRNEPATYIHFLEKSIYYVIIDFYSCNYNLSDEAVKKANEIVKQILIEVSGKHPRIEFSGSAGKELVSFSITEDALENAIKRIAPIVLDKNNWVSVKWGL